MASSKDPRGPEKGARERAVEDISSGDVEEYSRVARPPLVAVVAWACTCLLDVAVIDGAIVPVLALIAAPQVDLRDAAAAHDAPRLPINDGPKARAERIMMPQLPRRTIDRRGRPERAPSRHLLLMMGRRTADGRIGRIGD